MQLNSLITNMYSIHADASSQISFSGASLSFWAASSSSSIAALSFAFFSHFDLDSRGVLFGMAPLVCLNALASLSNAGAESNTVITARKNYTTRLNFKNIGTVDCKTLTRDRLISLKHVG